MKNFSILILLISSCLFILQTESKAQHFSPAWTGNPYQPMSVIVTEAIAGNDFLEAGDEIAVYDISENGSSICVGSIVLNSAISTSSPAIIICSSDDDLNNDVYNGFTPNNNILFKIWDSSESLEYSNASPIFNNSYDETFTQLGTAIATLSTCFEKDFDCDCDVDIVDVTSAAYRYGTETGDPEYDIRYDMDNDGDIDIVDITSVAYNYGWSCDD